MTLQIVFSGLVQGVGFRPAALRIAEELGITGNVKNSGGSVTICATGKKEALDDFIRRLTAVFEIKECSVTQVEERSFSSFAIEESCAENVFPFITPDIATCSECEKELKNSKNRRYRHPFISCVNCGARYSIMTALPYDRERTTMKNFGLCDRCRLEYGDSNDRRCFAQTIACNSCGPVLNMTIEEAAAILKSGKPLAVKGIGGYHLAGICTYETAKKIRKIKRRDGKPFAVMFSSVEEIMQYCDVNDDEKKLLTNDKRPIVLLKKKAELSRGICDGTATIGAFLPSDPVHIMLLDEVSPLIMTSANISSQPIITDDNKAKNFCGSVLSHNRDILTPLDDSVVQLNAGKTQFIRRARGYVPLAVDIGIKSDKNILCLGGDLKSSFAIASGGLAVPSQYFGDLENPDAFDSYKNNIKRFCLLHSFKPQLIVCDKHPGYYSSNLCADKKPMRIQHHLAHAYSVVAEHHIKGDALHFVFDGTGYGDDGKIWGGEVFLNTQRVAHLKYTKMIASDELERNADMALKCYDNTDPIINKARELNINTIESSSMGRLFDAVAAQLDIGHFNTYEGECATALETAAAAGKTPYYIEPTFDPCRIIAAVKNANAPKEDVALGFHIMLARLILETAKKYAVKQITLSGGCFINKVLLENAVKLLSENGYCVYFNNIVSPGDNGLCLGQAYLACMKSQRQNVDERII